MRVRFGTNALDDRVRSILVETLYTNPTNLTIGALTYKSIASIIANRLGNKAAGRRGHQPAVEQHANLRGPGYFH